MCIRDIPEIWDTLIQKSEKNTGNLYKQANKLTAVMDNFGIVKVYDSKNNATRWSKNKKKLNINE